MNKKRTEKDLNHSDRMADYEKKITALENKIKRLDKQYFQLKKLIDNLPGDIYWKDKKGVWVGMNKRCAQSLQRMGFIKNSTETEMIGKTDYQIFDQKTADGYRQTDLEVMKKKIELSREENTKLPSGQKIVLLSTKSPLWDQGGNVVGIVGNTIDISYLKQIETELRQAKIAAEAASLVKSKYIKNLKLAQRGEKKAVLKAAIASSRANAEEEMRKTVMVLVGDIVHDLRTPIATIRTVGSVLSTILPGMLQVIEEAKTLGSEKINLLNKKKLESIADNTMIGALQSAVCMMDEFINSTLAELSNAQKSQQTRLAYEDLTKCSSRRIIENTLEAFPFDENIKLHTHISYDFFLLGNSILLMKILFNLIRNSVEQIMLKGKGEITIMTENAGDRNLLKIKDTAGGASPEVLSKLFKGYFTTKIHGTGIGLAFCKKTMEDFRGDLTCHSVYGDYIEFILSFPKID